MCTSDYINHEACTHNANSRTTDGLPKLWYYIDMIEHMSII